MDCNSEHEHSSSKRNKDRHLTALSLLEEEIYELRQMMEHSYTQEQQFTSAVVLEWSHRLDVKLNEYMKLKKQ